MVGPPPPSHSILFRITKKYLHSSFRKDFSCIERQDKTTLELAAATPNTYCYFTPKGHIKKLINQSIKLPWPTLTLQQEKCNKSAVYDCKSRTLTTTRKPEAETCTIFRLPPFTGWELLDRASQLDFCFAPAFIWLSLF